jgi:Xaa-Pro aminopeptidase
MYGCVLARTLPVGERCPEPLRRPLEILADVVEAVAAAAKPGATLDRLEALAAERCPEEWRGRFEPGVGGSVGMEVEDPLDRERPLEVGVVLAIAPRIVDEERALAAAIADTVLVTESGGSFLTDFPRRPAEIEELARSGR